MMTPSSDAIRSPGLLDLQDAELVDQARAHQQSALRELYRRYATKIAGTAYRIMGRDDEIEDIVQETFLEAFLHLDSLSDASKFSAWIYKISVRKSWRRLKQRQRRNLLRTMLFQSPRQNLPKLSKDPHDSALSAELYQAMTGLQPSLRLPWILHHIEEHTHAEVAAICDISVATVKRRIKRADKSLKRRLAHA